MAVRGAEGKFRPTGRKFLLFFLPFHATQQRGDLSIEAIDVANFFIHLSPVVARRARLIQSFRGGLFGGLSGCAFVLEGEIVLGGGWWEGGVSRGWR